MKLQQRPPLSPWGGWSWDGPSEMSQTEARRLGQSVTGFGLPWGGGLTLDEAALFSQGQIQETPSSELSVASTPSSWENGSF